MAPVGQVGHDGPQAPLAGFVLMLDNVTRHFEEEAQRDQTLQALTDAETAARAYLLNGNATDLDAYRNSLAELDKVQRGELISRVTNDIDNITQTMQQSLSGALTAVLTVIGVLISDIALAILDPRIRFGGGNLK